jgi:hypothetical protein
VHGYTESRDERRIGFVSLRSREFALTEGLDRERIHDAHDVTVRVQMRGQLLAPTTGRFHARMHAADVPVRKPPAQSFKPRLRMRKMVCVNQTFSVQRTMKLKLPNVDAKNGQIHGNLPNCGSVDQSDTYELLP